MSAILQWFVRHVARIREYTFLYIIMFATAIIFGLIVAHIVGQAILIFRILKILIPGYWGLRENIYHVAVSSPREFRHVVQRILGQIWTVIWTFFKADIIVGLLAIFIYFFLRRTIPLADRFSHRLRRAIWKTWRHWTCSVQEPRQERDGNFHYSPLDPSDNEVRLLRLNPGENNEPIRIDIIRTSLNDRPRYFALSYVWGSTIVPYHILVDGKPKVVTKNLYLALRNLRNMKGQINEYTGILWWIDALSIDQSNYSERGHQVRLMRDIYSQANKVMVWLGPPTEDSELALATIRAMDAQMLLLGAKFKKEDDEKEKSEGKQNKNNIAKRSKGRQKEKSGKGDEKEKDDFRFTNAGKDAETKTENIYKTAQIEVSESTAPRAEYSGTFSMEQLKKLRQIYNIDEISAGMRFHGLHRSCFPWEPLIKFLFNPWWDRVWIAQEVTSPASHATPDGNVEFILGRQLQTIPLRGSVESLSFELQRYASNPFQDEQRNLHDLTLLKTAEDFSSRLYRLTSIAALRRLQGYHSAIGRITEASLRLLRYHEESSAEKSERELWISKVLPMLDRFSNLECQDPRDKVYASLPLVLPSSHPGFAPDYSLSVEQVFVQVIKNFIQYEGSLSILAFRSGSDPNMPSWIRDWRSSDPDEPDHILCVRNDARGQRIYRAGGDELLEATISETSISLLPSGKLSKRNILTVRGVHVDKIVQLISIKSDLGKPMSRNDWEALSWELPDDCAYPDESPECACWRTLVADIFDQENHFGVLPTESLTPQSTLLIILEYLEMKLYNWIMQIPQSEPRDWQSVIWQGMRVLVTTHKKDAWRRIKQVGEDFNTFSDFFDGDQVSKHTAKESTDSKTRRPKGHRRDVFDMTFEEVLANTTSDRLFCVTENGYFGLVPKRAQVGDQIVVLFGGHTPFVLREREEMSDISLEKQLWQLIGESYVHGMMDGEALNGLKEGHVSTEEFILI